MAMDQVLKKVADAALPEPLPPMTSLPRVMSPPAPAALAKQPGPAELLLALDAATGNLPAKFWRNARADARRHNYEESFTAFEDAFDAVLSALE